MNLNKFIRNFSQNMVNQTHLKKGDAIPIFPQDGKLQLLAMRFCPFAQRIHHVLAAKNIPYHTAYINLTDKPEWLTQFSPLGKVPALGLPNESNNPFIYESLLVADYLEDKYPETPLYPSDAMGKIQQRLLIEQFSGAFPSVYKLMTAGRNDEEFKKLTNSLDSLELEFNKFTESYLSRTDKPGMVDYMIWPLFERIDVLQFSVGDDYKLNAERFPKLLQWREKMIGDPVVGQMYLTGDVHAKFLAGRATGNPDYDMLWK